MAIASLILGIVSIITGPGGTLFAIIGLILGVLAKKKDSDSKPAKIGFILSIVGLILSILACIGCVACGGALMADSYYYY